MNITAPLERQDLAVPSEDWQVQPSEPAAGDVEAEKQAAAFREMLQAEAHALPAKMEKIITDVVDEKLRDLKAG